jgi:hypothetical protein
VLLMLLLLVVEVKVLLLLPPLLLLLLPSARLGMPRALAMHLLDPPTMTKAPRVVAPAVLASESGATGCFSQSAVYAARAGATTPTPNTEPS